MTTLVQESDDGAGNDHEQAGALSRDVMSDQDRDHLVSNNVERLAATAHEERTAATTGRAGNPGARRPRRAYFISARLTAITSMPPTSPYRLSCPLP